MKKTRKTILIPTIFLILTIFASAASAADIAVSSVNTEPVPSLPGSLLKVWITVKNNGPGDAENVSAELELSDSETNRGEYPFSFPEDETKIKEIGPLQSGQSALVKYNVIIAGEAVNGDYIITIKTAEKGQEGRKIRQTITILSRKPKIELIGSSLQDAKPGQTVETMLALKNIGSSKALNVVAGIKEDRTVTSDGTVVERKIKPVGTAFKLAGDIAPNQEQKISLTLSVDNDAESKAYSIPITINYQDENRNDYSTTSYIGVNVITVAELDAAVSTAQPIASPGKTSEITIEVFNVGSATANNVVVEVSSPAFAELEQEKFFIGNLEADDFDSFRTKAKIKDNLKAGNYPVNLKISFKDERLEKKIENKALNLKVYSAEEAAAQNNGNAAIPALIIVMIVAIAVFAFYKKVWKKRKK